MIWLLLLLLSRWRLLMCWWPLLPRCLRLVCLRLLQGPLLPCLRLLLLRLLHLLLLREPLLLCLRLLLVLLLHLLLLKGPLLPCLRLLLLPWCFLLLRPRRPLCLRQGPLLSPLCSLLLLLPLLW